MSRHPSTWEVLYLLGKGVPWDVIMQMSATRRLGFVVAAREMSGKERFDWTAQKWVEVS
ncbi:protein of unknown function (plasmid) [Rhodovastum atsumiense]|nr:protein of unknown function [Rhodovastum atsumiense]